MIQLTVDTPCIYPDAELPVLELKVNMNPIEGNQIDFEFFENPTNNSRPTSQARVCDMEIDKPSQKVF